METIARENAGKESVNIGEAIERILIESGLSISAFARKVGYSRQYIYELLKSKDGEVARKIQLDTLKRICDATGYGLERLLVETGYISRNDYVKPNSVIVVHKGGDSVSYDLEENAISILKGLTSSLMEKDR